MRRPPLRSSVFLIITLFVLMLSFPAVRSLYNKADLPIVVYSSGQTILVNELKISGTHLKKDFRIIAIDNITLNDREDIEIIMDTRDIGQLVNIRYSDGSSVSSVELKAVPFYSLRFITVQAFTGLVFIFFGLFVLVKSKFSKAGEFFHLAMLGVAVLLNMTWGRFNSSSPEDYLTRFIFQAAYVFTPLFLVHFGLVFPVNKSRKYRIFLSSLYLAGSAILAVNIYAFFRTINVLSPENLDKFIAAFNLNRFFLVLCVVISISVFLLGYTRTENIAERKKLKWLISGFLVGPLSFIILWVIPQAITDYALIPEEYISPLMLAVPVTFSISILKYHILDIDFIINRGIVYSALITLVIFIYFGLVLTASYFIQDANRMVLSTLSAVFVAFLFNPLKNYLHNFVDRKFFRVQYNFRKAVKSFFEEIKEINDIRQLADEVVKGTSDLIPVKKIALLDLSDNSFPLLLSSHHFYESDLEFIKEKIFTVHDLSKVIASQDKTEYSSRKLYTADENLKQIDLACIFSSYQQTEKVQLVLAIGNKKSGYRYSPEDIDLLQNILNTSSSVMSRIKLQQALVRKNMETEKLQELNEQKSLFVSTVSHELKTPLTSIKMYSELLQMNEEIKKEKIDIYSGYIVGEAERLTRLIDNVLNFSMIEKGIKTYRKRIIDLSSIIKKSIELMDYQFRLTGFKVKSAVNDTEMMIYADPDALLEIFINLMSNSIKYSADVKFFEICSREEGETYSISFSDFGLGMSKQDLEKLYVPFFRSKTTIDNRIPGTGLGLSIIKHIADSHDIKIEIQSELSKGTTFILKIPKLLKE